MCAWDGGSEFVTEKPWGSLTRREVRGVYTPDDPHEELPKAPPGGSGEVDCNDVTEKMLDRVAEAGDEYREGMSRLAAVNEFEFEAGPVRCVPHEFLGRQDQGCSICGKPDRHWIHMRITVEMMNQIKIGLSKEELCEECSAKPGSPYLCPACLKKRDMIDLELKFPDGTKRRLQGKRSDFSYLTGGLTQECLDKAKAVIDSEKMKFPIEIVLDDTLPEGTALLISPNHMLPHESMESWVKRSVVRIGR